MATQSTAWYRRHLAPCLVHAACSFRPFSRMRQKMVPKAEGLVVEIGFGSGLNLPYYDPGRVERLAGVDPDPTMLDLAERRSRGLPFRIDRLEAGGESIPLEDGSADTVVFSYALCTIPDPGAALAEARRILRPLGRLIYCEHGQGDTPLRRRWQDRLNRPWGCLAGGCNLNRNPARLIRDAGFVFVESREQRFGGVFWHLGLHYSGIAVRPAA